MASIRLLYITGRGGNHQSGLGEYLQTRDVFFSGLSLTEDFLKNDFNEQLNNISICINASNPSHVIANSYGAYLLLHVLLKSEPLPIEVLLLSPILGKGLSQNRLVRPPMAKTLHNGFMSGNFPKPSRLEIHIGECDFPELAQEIAAMINVDLCNVIPRQGHQIEPSIVKEIIRGFL